MVYGTTAPTPTHAPTDSGGVPVPHETYVPLSSAEAVSDGRGRFAALARLGTAPSPSPVTSLPRTSLPKSRHLTKPTVAPLQATVDLLRKYALFRLVGPVGGSRDRGAAAGEVRLDFTLIALGELRGADGQLDVVQGKSRHGRALTRAVPAAVAITRDRATPLHGPTVVHVFLLLGHFLLDLKVGLIHDVLFLEVLKLRDGPAREPHEYRKQGSNFTVALDRVVGGEGHLRDEEGAGQAKGRDHPDHADVARADAQGRGEAKPVRHTVHQDDAPCFSNQQRQRHKQRHGAQSVEFDARIDHGEDAQADIDVNFEKVLELVQRRYVKVHVAVLVILLNLESILHTVAH
mmetsp:Transcript_32690/g.86349  ORF Transcript_32690/g.86349 Transcript_32690/m.86349 type:complete len:347 (-) Transcript_32690:2011-3051(-)